MRDGIAANHAGAVKKQLTQARRESGHFWKE
jgi:hypothetical protein